MSLQIYFDSYRKAVLSDAPNGFVEYAKQQPVKSEQFPTFFSYMQYVTNCITKSIEADNSKSFDSALKDHRAGMIELFKKMSSEKGNFSNGWKSFKFSDEIICFESGVQVVPRHGLEPAKGDDVIVYATEMDWVKDRPTATKLIKFKQVNGNKFVKLVDGKMVGFDRLMNFETPEVIEWTADL